MSHIIESHHQKQMELYKILIVFLRGIYEESVIHQIIIEVEKWKIMITNRSLKAPIIEDH